MIKITVITCVYNAAATLPRTLESVAGQSLAEVEHLIIDGHSHDNTVSLAEEYRQREAARGSSHEIVIISEPDRGLYDAMNKGLHRATGHYLVFLNAGDTFADADTLSAVARTAEAADHLPGVVYGDTDIVDGEGHFLRHRRLQAGADLSWRSFKHGMLVCHQAFYALTAIARQTPYDTRYRFSADVDWCIRVMRESERQGRRLEYAHRVVAHYLEEGMTTANHKASLRERFRVMTAHYGLPTTLLMHLWFVVRRII